MSKNKSILMNMPGDLRFTKDGEWLNDQALVTNEKVAQYFSRNLRWDAEHSSFIVEVDGKCVLAEVEDTPHVVRGFLTEQLPWKIRLDTGEEKEFDASSLSVNLENVFYCRAEGVEGKIRVLRSPLQTLLPLISEHTNEYRVQIGNEFFAITKDDSSTWR